MASSNVISIIEKNQVISGIFTELRYEAGRFWVGVLVGDRTQNSISAPCVASSPNGKDWILSAPLTVSSGLMFKPANGNGADPNAQTIAISPKGDRIMVALNYPFQSGAVTGQGFIFYSNDGGSTFYDTRWSNMRNVYSVSCSNTAQLGRDCRNNLTFTASVDYTRGNNGPQLPVRPDGTLCGIGHQEFLFGVKALIQFSGPD